MTKKPNGKIPPGETPELPQPPTEKPQARQVREIEIPANNNAFTLKLKNRRFISVMRNNQEIVRDESAGDSANFQLPPGKYTIVTDGEVEDVQFETIERTMVPGHPVGESHMEKLLKSNATILTNVSPPGMLPSEQLGVSDIPKRVTLSRLLRHNPQPIPEVDIPALVDEIIDKGEVPPEIDLPPGVLDRIAPDGRLIEEPAFISPPPPIPDIDTLPPQLFATVEAPDRHPIDGIPVAPADGTEVTINIQKVNAIGEVLGTQLDDDIIYVRTTGGIISIVTSGVPSFRLAKGRGSIRVRGKQNEDTLITVSFLSQTLPPVEVQIQFYNTGTG